VNQEFSLQLAIVYLQQLRKVIQTNKVFYLSFVFIWLLGLSVQFTFTQFQISIFINGLYSTLGDVLMNYTTYTGDGFFLVLVGIILVFINRKLWLVTLLCLLVPSLITQLLKHFVFEDSHRPVTIMREIQGLHFVEGVEMNAYNSFPSGHTTAAFSLYTLLALLHKNKKLGWVWVIIASSIAISRVYLLQHFWADIIAGSILAVCMVTFIYTFFAAKLRIDEITTNQ
jgi:membrane-associated phospholipid phosphatase